MATTTQIQREAPELEKMKLSLLATGKKLVETPLDLPDYKIAGFSPEQIEAMRMGKAGIGAYQPFMQQGSAGLNAAMGVMGSAASQFINPSVSQMPSAFSAIAPQGAAPMDQGIGALPTGEQGTGAAPIRQGIGALPDVPALGNVDPTTGQAMMNPYQQSVIDASLRQIQRQGDIKLQDLQAQATKAGAFGGYREGVQRAELEGILANERNDAIVNALSKGFESNQSRALEAAGQLGNMAVQQGTLGEQAQRLANTDTDVLYNIGEKAQRQAQAGLDAGRASAVQDAMQPYQNLAFLNDLYRGSPSNTMSLLESSTPQASPFQQAAGVATGMLATGAAAKQAGVI
jgi:hypothetical protein